MLGSTPMHGEDRVREQRARLRLERHTSLAPAQSVCDLLGGGQLLHIWGRGWAKGHTAGREAKGGQAGGSDQPNPKDEGKADDTGKTRKASQDGTARAGALGTTPKTSPQ